MAKLARTNLSISVRTLATGSLGRICTADTITACLLLLLRLLLLLLLRLVLLLLLLLQA
jgi:hypothetical protein